MKSKNYIVFSLHSVGVLLPGVLLEGISFQEICNFHFSAASIIYLFFTFCGKNIINFQGMKMFLRGIFTAIVASEQVILFVLFAKGRHQVADPIR